MPDNPLHTPEGRAAAFATFRGQSGNRFMTKLRQRRAEQIRDLFTDPAAMTLDRFNHEIWQISHQVLLRGQPIADRIFDGTPGAARLAELHGALDAGELEVIGNTMWKAGSTVYGSRSREDAAAKEAYIRRAFEILADTTLAPYEQFKRLDLIPGFGTGASGLLTMIANPTGWILDNDQSRGGLSQLGYTATSSNEVQVTASQLRDELGTTDFIELDLFLYLLNQRPKANATGPTIWWVNQGKSYETEKLLSSIQASPEGADGRHVPGRAAVADVRPGDIIVHHSRKYIRAVSQVQSEPQLVSLTNGEQMRRASTVYHELATPIRSADVGEAIYALGLASGPIREDFAPKQSYLHPLGTQGLRIIYETSPRNTWPPYVTALFPSTPTLDKADGRPSGTVAAIVPPFQAVMEALHQSKLTFPPEVVSTYLLALQSKGFVILTGISGTGKTQLALEIARHFQPMQRQTIVAKPPDGARSLTVQRYTAQRGQMVLPVDVVEELSLATEVEGGQSVLVYYPGGSLTLRLYKYPRRDTFMLRLRDHFRTWFQSTLQLGDTFFLEVLPPGESGEVALRFSVPLTTVQERRLENYKVLAVQPDWTDAHGLLGYFNPLTRRYESTPFLRFLLEAAREAALAEAENREANPFFVVLDEMNLARVEYYFADFLSSIESGEDLELHDDPDIEAGVGAEAELVPVPRRVKVPRNLFFTGTVNVDETTSMFSPKVLDRAFTIEFNHVELRRLGSPKPDAPASPLILTNLPARLLQPAKISRAEWTLFEELEDGALLQVVVALNELLADEQRHFGYRVANEIARFVNLTDDQTEGSPATLWAALDGAILAKALPKLAGTQQELEPLLARLFAFALRGEAGGDTLDVDSILHQWRDRGGQITALADAPSAPAKLPRTAAKLWRMLRRLRQQGFTAFVC